MLALRKKKEGRSEKEQQRAVSGRMITDIEMNGTLRGAVEEFNLCRNLRRGDFLFAECFRTFKTEDMNAQQWLHRLAVELEKVEELRALVYVPPTPVVAFSSVDESRKRRAFCFFALGAL